MGQKIMIGLILGGFGTIVGLSMNFMLAEATAGKTIALEDRSRIATLEANTDYIRADLSEIKGLLKRAVTK